VAPRIAGIRETILIAPDSFKGTFTAVEVAEAIGDGLRDGGRSVDVCPAADGGEGTMDALVAAMDGTVHAVTVCDPLGREVTAQFALAGSTGIVEMAAASGLGLVAESERDPLEASTFGTGQLLVAAAQAGATTILLGVGGSATTDGGSGAIRAIKRAGGLGGARLVVLCDVRTAFADAARVFGPQKGADPDQVKKLTARLNAQARRLPRDPRGQPMTGAAGGLSGGLWAACGAELVSGASFVLDEIGFDARMRGARAVITGEGKLDEQSLVGKVVSEVATRSRQAGIPCSAVVGTRQLDAMGARVLDLERVLEASTVGELRDAGRRLAKVL
jgi:glycerate 2-kinase